MSFSEFKDHALVAAQLQRSLERGRLAHAYLFSGDRHSGKEAVARALAQALNCPHRKADFCGVCQSCRQISEHQHPDVHWIRPESKSRRITVEQIRDFEQAVNLKALAARVKLGIIVDADCMGEEASNAFLKTLEEPPAQTIMILLTAEPQRLLPTILSRCLRIAFGPGVAITSPYRQRVVSAVIPWTETCDCSLASIYRLHANLSVLFAALRQEVRQQVEADLAPEADDNLDAKARDRRDSQFEARVEGEYRAARELMMEELYSWFVDIWLCAEGVDSGLLSHPDHLDILRQAGAKLSSSHAMAFLDGLESARDAMLRNIQDSLALEVGLLSPLKQQ